MENKVWGIWGWSKADEGSGRGLGKQLDYTYNVYMLDVDYDSSSPPHKVK